MFRRSYGDIIFSSQRFVSESFTCLWSDLSMKLTLFQNLDFWKFVQNVYFNAQFNRAENVISIYQCVCSCCQENLIWFFHLDEKSTMFFFKKMWSNQQKLLKNSLHLNNFVISTSKKMHKILFQMSSHLKLYNRFKMCFFFISEA